MRVRIDPLAVFVQRDFQPTDPSVRNSITFVILDQPGREGRRRKSRVSARNAKIKDALPSRKNFVPQTVWKKLGQPGSTRKHKVFCRELFFAEASCRAAARNILHFAIPARLCNRCKFEVHPDSNRFGKHRCDRASRHQHAALWLLNATRYSLRIRLRISADNHLPFEFLKLHSPPFQDFFLCLQLRFTECPNPQHSPLSKPPSHLIPRTHYSPPPHHQPL